MKSQYLYNKQITSWLVREYDFYSLVNYYKLSSFAALTRSLVIIHSWIKIVRAHQPWSNLYFHQRFVTKSRLIALLVILQLPLTVFHIAKHIAKHIPTVVALFFALLVATFLATFFLNYQILLVTRKLRQSSIVPLGTYNGSDHSYLNKNQRKVTLKKISTCSLAVACLTVCHFPHVVYIILILTGQLNDDWSVTTFHHWADTIVAMNPVSTAWYSSTWTARYVDMDGRYSVRPSIYRTRDIQTPELLLEYIVWFLYSYSYI
jgi:hypothetical protein